MQKRKLGKTASNSRPTFGGAAIPPAAPPPASGGGGHGGPFRLLLSLRARSWNVSGRVNKTSMPTISRFVVLLRVAPPFPKRVKQLFVEVNPHR
jgi:hypothetical protein